MHYSLNAVCIHLSYLDGFAFNAFNVQLYKQYL